MLTEDHNGHGNGGSGPGGNPGPGGGGNPGPDGHDEDKFTVDVIYNGITKPFEVRRDELVKTLLDKAIAQFGSIPQPHLLSLYKGGNPLDDSATLHAAGVKPHDALLLRPNAVKGG